MHIQQVFRGSNSHKPAAHLAVDKNLGTRTQSEVEGVRGPTVNPIETCLRIRHYQNLPVVIKDMLALHCPKTSTQVGLYLRLQIYAILDSRCRKI